MLLHDFLTKSAQEFPDKEALIFGNHRITYRELNRQANRLAHALIDLGVERGDRVAIFLDNSPESVIALFGVLKAGAVFIMLSAALKAGKLGNILNQIGARVLISHKNKRSIFDGIHLSTSLIKIIIGEDENQKGSPCDLTWANIVADPPDHVRVSVGCPSDLCPARQNIDLDLAALIYTSGSTGDPKDVMMTHLNMVCAATSIIRYLKNTADDIICGKWKIFSAR